jgi:general secretion pathway protein G
MFPSRKRNTRLVHRRQFSMVELLLVLVIMAILAGIVIPKFTGRSEQARETAAKTQISSIELALDAFEIDNGYYPKTSDGLAALTTEPKNGTNWKGPYLKKAIANDPWGNPYSYQCPGTHNTSGYDISSPGSDGKLDSDDDITNWSEE